MSLSMCRSRASWAASREAWPGDRVVLCSDGLSNAVAEKEIARVLETFPGDPEKAAHGLVTAA